MLALRNLLQKLYFYSNVQSNEAKFNRNGFGVEELLESRDKAQLPGLVSCAVRKPRLVPASSLKTVLFTNQSRQTCTAETDNL